MSSILRYTLLLVLPTSFTSIHTPFPVNPRSFYLSSPNFLLHSHTLPQPWAESLAPASGWHSACGRGRPSGFRGLSCQLPFSHEGVAAAAALDLGLCVGCHRGQYALCDSLLHFVFGKLRSSLHWKLSMYHSKKAYLSDFTKAWFDNDNNCLFWTCLKWAPEVSDCKLV